eukprot:gene56219-77057_t
MSLSVERWDTSMVAKAAVSRVAPEIAPNYLSDPRDVVDILAGARFLRRLAATPTFAALIESEIKPGPHCADDAALLQSIRQQAYSVFHPCGTCRMGPDPAACRSGLHGAPRPQRQSTLAVARQRHRSRQRSRSKETATE